MEELVGPAVQVVRRNDIVADLSYRQQREGRSSLARRKCQRTGSAFERRHALLGNVGGRIHDARIDISKFFESEQIGRVICAFEGEGGGLIDWDRARSGGWIWSLTTMQCYRADVI